MMSEETGAFAAHLKALRLRAALSQRDLARRAGIVESTVVRLEAGGQPPRPSTIRKLAAALKVTPATLTPFPEQVLSDAQLDGLARILGPAIDRVAARHAGATEGGYPTA